MRIAFILPAFVSLVLSCLAYSRTPVEASTANGSVAGIVAAPGLTNASGLKVFLRRANGSSASSYQTTGTDGSFVFYDIAPGMYSVEVDAATIPDKYRNVTTEIIQVKARVRAEAKVILEPRRSIVGHTFLDMDGDGVYTPAKDRSVAGAQVSVDGSFVVSSADGSFHIDGLSSGRTSLVVTWPGGDHTTHVVLDIGDGPVTDRIVNIPLFR